MHRNPWNRPVPAPQAGNACTRDTNRGSQVLPSVFSALALDASLVAAAYGPVLGQRG